MAVVARRVEIAAGLDDLVLVLRPGGGHRQPGLVHHGVGHLHPVARVDGATARKYQVARLDDGGARAFHLRPLLVRLRRDLLDTLVGALGADGLVDHVRRGIGDADHDLLDRGDRRRLDRGGRGRGRRRARRPLAGDDESDAADEQQRADGEEPVDRFHASSEDVILSLWNAQSYNTGSRINVSAVELTSPPMTTEASGRCTSAPVDVAMAIGMKPTLATSAVMSTGRSRRSAPPSTAS